jgi:DNA-binding response OmpR family regulator
MHEGCLDMADTSDLAGGMETVGARRVLLAEDDDDMRSLLGSVLRTRGLAVMEFRSGRDLVAGIGGQLLRGARIDSVQLIVTDVRMPDFSGLEVLRAVRRTGWAVPAIVITAFDVDRVRSEAHALDAVLLEKPFALSAFTRAASACLARYEPPL